MASSSAGDCAFEDDMCGWTSPGRADGLDEINWDRLEAARGEPRFPQVNQANHFFVKSVYNHVFCIIRLITPLEIVRDTI